MIEDTIYFSNFWCETTGLDTIIWIGTRLNPYIKISNTSDKTLSFEDSFIITVPDFKIIGKVNSKYITKKKIDKIYKFIKLNETIIIQHCNDEIDDGIFISKMIKV